MTALDDAEKLARERLGDGYRPGLHASERPTSTEEQLARMLLAVLPVVRSLLAELERGEDEEGNSTMVTVATLNALDTMHAAPRKT